ncbi:hypothetical protein BRC86_07125 [Halobacteriales archaeon QS_3_64_16]|nr:MAG: hypothetical protein BRC86_07125 [Halobacteriales archaeon QS_3_64_16]
MSQKPRSRVVTSFRPDATTGESGVVADVPVEGRQFDASGRTGGLVVTDRSVGVGTPTGTTGPKRTALSPSVSLL